jgi:hypothetical protein
MSTGYSPIDVRVKDAAKRECKKSSACSKLAICTSPKASGDRAPESSDEVADGPVKSIKVDEKGREDNELGPFAAPNPDHNTTKPMTTFRTCRPRISKYTTFRRDRGASPRNPGEPARTSGNHNHFFPRPTCAVKFDGLPVLSNPVSSRPPVRTRYNTSSRSRADLLPTTLPKAVSFSPFAKSRRTEATHDPGNITAKTTSQKQTSGLDITGHSGNSKKKPRLDKCDELGLERQAENLIYEKISLGRRVRHLLDNDNRQGVMARYEKTCDSPDQGNKIKSSLAIQPHRRLLTPKSTFSCSKDMAPGSVPQQMRLLPQNSPLNNVIISATLHEERVQAKLRISLVQKQLIKEKTKRGYTSRETSARLQALNVKLAALHEKRGEIRDDERRMKDFRREDLRGPGYKAKGWDRITTEGTPCFQAQTVSKHRLMLCCEGIERTEQGHEAIKEAKESATLSAEDKPVIKQETCDQHASSWIKEAGDQELAAPQRLQVLFGLTDVETFL